MLLTVLKCNRGNLLVSFCKTIIPRQTIVMWQFVLYEKVIYAHSICLGQNYSRSLANNNNSKLNMCKQCICAYEVVSNDSNIRKISNKE